MYGAYEYYYNDNHTAVERRQAVYAFAVRVTNEIYSFLPPLDLRNSCTITAKMSELMKKINLRPPKSQLVSLFKCIELKVKSKPKVNVSVGYIHSSR